MLVMESESGRLSAGTTRCTKCRKVLTAGVEYRNTIWHRDCLTCSNCSTKLAGTKFTTINNEPFCVMCYGNLHAYKCQACRGPIYGLGDGFLIYMEGNRWHIECFRCRLCQAALLGETTFNTPEGVQCKNCSRTSR